MPSSIPTSKRKPFTPAEAKTTGEKLGIDWQKFTVKQFLAGMNAELADGTYNPMTNFASDDPNLVGKVVRAHLNESPDYYTQWTQMEKEAELERDRKPIVTRNQLKNQPKKVEHKGTKVPKIPPKRTKKSSNSL